MPDPEPNGTEIPYDEFGAEEYDFEPPNFLEEALHGPPTLEPERPERAIGPNPDILGLAEDYLRSANATVWVRRSIPILFASFGAKVADQHNLRHPIHYYGPEAPYRYLYHITNLGASGHNKGATVDAFFRIVGDDGPDGPPIVPTYDFKGGSIESIRGGIFEAAIPQGKGKPLPVLLTRPGSLERTDGGYIHIPEFSQLAALEERSGGAIQSLLAWTDNGVMSYDTLSWASVEFGSSTTLIVGLQPDKLNATETTVLGWNRRTAYEVFAPPTTEESKPENRPEATRGDPEKLATLRGALRQLVRSYAPTAIDWTSFRRWLSKGYEAQLLNWPDESLLYSLALGFYLVSGGRWTGKLSIPVPEWLNDRLRAAVSSKRRARIDPVYRAALDCIEVLRDPYVLRAPREDRILVEILAARLSLPEERVWEALPIISKFGPAVRHKDDDDVDRWYRSGVLDAGGKAPTGA